jgi:hypothetical protein
MPPLIRCKSLRSQTDLSSHPELELVICNLKESEKLSYQYPDIILIDQSIGEFQGTPTYGNVSVAKTIKDDVTVALHGHGVNGDYFVESVKSDVAAMQR